MPYNRNVLLGLISEIEDVLEPGVFWFKVSPSQHERLRYGSSVKKREQGLNEHR
ncbi:hypothetical protein GCM10010911_16000 [Paenibacillus nasutitermitis]|uniref:Uncharacterized protein n=1 Tax=Paenibacillus nasutitermitis TaxID=1652958 RepID=A0A916YSF0_9BACL|nr:hypothetical protein GCM10010911_16000 [Paenibacillus nasutitermitis]